MSSGAFPAGIVEQPLRDVLPDCVGAVQAHCVNGLDFHGPLATAARDAQYMALDLGKTLLPHLGAGRAVTMMR